VPQWGATCAGARDFLIAYNVNVLGTKEQAHRIALNVREQGRGPGEPGRLQAVRAIGWWVEEYGLAQVSINLEDYKTTPPHVAFEACAEEARALNLAVAGSELVGLIPLRAMLMAAEHYIAKEDLFILDERQRVRLVVGRLGLSSVQPFVPERRIIEYMIPKGEEEPLASMSVRGFVELLGSRTPAPGGGSASALIAAMGAALGAMVGWMTYGKRKFEDQDAAMRRLIPTLHEGMNGLLPLIDRDTRAFDVYLAAVGMPKGTAEEKAGRHAAMQDGLKAAIQVPLEVMRTADRCWEAMAEMATHGNSASRSDLEVGAKALEAGIWGALRNVAINLPGLEDETLRRATAQEAEALAARAALMRDKVLKALAARPA
jgi:glutamate formiminotransferase/formiminotetrahydrofolate cyclodeaminase